MRLLILGIGWGGVEEEEPGFAEDDWGVVEEEGEYSKASTTRMSFGELAEEPIVEGRVFEV